MYDTMDATFKFAGDKVIKWDGKSRNGYDTYGGGRGTIIYGSEGSVFIDRGKFIVYDRRGEKIGDNESLPTENALGSGTRTGHVSNFLDGIRGTSKLNSHIADAVVSQALSHYSNIAYRIGKGFDVDDKTGKIFDRDAMKLWGREYAAGWEPKF